MMKSRIFRMTLPALVLLVMTFSCEKENINSDGEDIRAELESAESTNLDDDGSVFEGTVVDYPIVLDQPDTTETTSLIQAVNPDQQSIGLRTRAITVVRGRRQASSSSSSDSRSSCAKDFFIDDCYFHDYASTDEDYQGIDLHRFSTYDNDHYHRYNLRTDLNGYEKVYYLRVYEEKNYTFKLSGHHKDLAMILLKGIDGDEPGGFSCNNYNGMVEVREPGEKLVSYTVAKAHRNSYLGPVRLKKGLYFLVIDSKRHYGSHFNLEVHCQKVHESCDYRDIFYDKFAAYQYGNLSPQSVYWEKWYPQAHYDAEVINTGNRSLGPAMKMYHRHHYDYHHQPNVLLCLGDRKYGKYKLKFLLYVPHGHSGYFNIQRELTEKNAHNAVGAEFFFYGDGKGMVKVNGHKKYFYYHTGKWNEVYLEFDFKHHHGHDVEFGINHHKIHSWDMHHKRGLEALNFYTRYNDSKFYVDRVCFTDETY